MKKTLLLLAGLSFLIPMTASATLVGTGTMNIDWSSPNVNASFNNGSNYGWYYGDADIISTSYSGPTLKSLEAFCVEKSDYLPGKTYTFWSIDTASFGSAGTNGTKTIYDKYVEATWLANHALTASGDSDTNKAIAQAAIWSTVIDGAIISSSWSHYQDVQNLLSLFSGATNKNAYVNNWIVAADLTTTAQTVTGVFGYQNFLVNVNAPVPEPATMLLFGTGIAGLAGIARRRRMNS